MSKLQVEVLTFTKNKLEVKLRGEGHMILNLLVSELNSDPRVMAAYRVEHPLLDVVYLHVTTEGDLSPLDALEEAARRLDEKLASLRNQLLEAFPNLKG
uniref:DNA-directed RNA polymerase subunit Rpo11 n=1 Tax=Thermofilum pendens TaxID=2269 RepID=A0A7C4FE33_THEPE